MQVPVSTPHTLQVVVNGVPSSCATPGGCTFQQRAADTPSLAAVSPSHVDFSAGGSTAVLTLTGDGFDGTAPANNKVC